MMELKMVIEFVAAQNSMVFISKASNCSQDGICFEPQASLSPGAVVFIAAADELRYYRADVKWTEKVERTGPERYTVGAEYVDPL